uniref:Uncharacterized protein n=1 Tax=Schizaphis graminum TaxID=13262 RepID=A0A2S2P2A8_SCHGA
MTRRSSRRFLCVYNNNNNNIVLFGLKTFSYSECAEFRMTRTYGRRGPGGVRAARALTAATRAYRSRAIRRRSGANAPSRFVRARYYRAATSVTIVRDDFDRPSRTMGNWVVAVCWPHWRVRRSAAEGTSCRPESWSAEFYQNIRHKKSINFAAHPPTDSRTIIAYLHSPPPPSCDSFSLYVRR